MSLLILEHLQKKHIYVEIRKMVLKTQMEHRNSSNILYRFFLLGTKMSIVAMQI